MGAAYGSAVCSVNEERMPSSSRDGGDGEGEGAGKDDGGGKASGHGLWLSPALLAQSSAHCNWMLG